MTASYGITFPFDGIPLTEQRSIIESLPDLGYTDLWSAESNGMDGFTPLALASVWAPQLRLGTAIVPVYTRGPATLAMSAATMAAAAPGRFVLGIGTSSNVIVERWNSAPFEAPYQRVRDTLTFLKASMGGEKVTEDYETFSIKGFRLGFVPPSPPKILVAALRSGMLRLAGREADGAITNWLAAEDVARIAPYIHEGGPDKEIAARIFVAPTSDHETARAVGRFAIAAYLTVPVYRAFHDWLGRTEMMAPMQDAWAAGDRKAALEAIPDELVDALVVHGEPAACREQLSAYVEAGITTPIIALLPVGVDPADAARSLAPTR
ncbi:MAG TPA: LLM class F420-dependent oxidoreductase [Mycobacteriales bacterium]|nr:LLM class F420-dependent oxidoreductase [Mycobacteriales bacterium]